jgi:hypothetical protein
VPPVPRECHWLRQCPAGTGAVRRPSFYPRQRLLSVPRARVPMIHDSYRSCAAACPRVRISRKTPSGSGQAVLLGASEQNRPEIRIPSPPPSTAWRLPQRRLSHRLQSLAEPAEQWHPRVTHRRTGILACPCRGVAPGSAGHEPSQPRITHPMRDIRGLSCQARMPDLRLLPGLRLPSGKNALRLGGGGRHGGVAGPLRGRRLAKPRPDRLHLGRQLLQLRIDAL